MHKGSCIVLFNIYYEITVYKNTLRFGFWYTNINFENWPEKTAEKCFFSEFTFLNRANHQQRLF